MDLYNGFEKGNAKILTVSKIPIVILVVILGFLFLILAIALFLLYRNYFNYIGVSFGIAGASMEILAVKLNFLQQNCMPSGNNFERDNLLLGAKLTNTEKTRDFLMVANYDDFYDKEKDYSKIANAKNSELVLAAKIVGEETWSWVQNAMEQLLGGPVINNKQKRSVSFVLPEREVNDDSEDSFASLEKALERLDSYVANMNEQIEFD
ncbi:unnamed protein product [Bursaphelenchus okinawaensis]|uniref:Uncharacterized protein n=1 Tax=Bursaphelenchus okinawaensis TaxID=465554 RepID=A0A811K0M6_9BILA|nr:unnamed protein product [Bursaphelenchus okinawaensis]CAG9088297.1 unnamed protein product [Bursaphelenchus okinawaensis]